ncbi:MAG: PorT family protein [Bacteroidales bacterium]|nr:PorT family protein [Bacteroidales bacterium]
MQESFDEKMSNKIRSTFENYNEPFNNDAWKLMQEKLTDKKKKKAFIWFIDIAKAASIILFVGIGVLWPFKTNHQFSNTDNSILVNDSTFKNKEITDKNNILNIAYNSNKTDKQEFVKKDNSIVKQPFKEIQNNNTKQNYITDNKIEININRVLNDSVKNEEEQEKKIFADLAKVVDKDSINNKTSIDTVKDNRPILMPDDKDFFIEKKTGKKFNFGLAVSSHFSSSEIGATDNINIGGGVLTEYRISKRISINSGLLLTNHHMNTESSSLFGSLKSYDAVETAFAGSSETEILLVGLDIPLNVKFNFDKMYISTGVSSLVYLKESYFENYYVENTQEVYNSQTNSYETLYLYDQVSENQESGAFKTFDFAKLFNFSVGYKIPLKKGSLIFEPYAKIPIGNLTSYNISYGYGGLALKYDF